MLIFRTPDQAIPTTTFADTACDSFEWTISLVLLMSLGRELDLRSGASRYWFEGGGGEGSVVSDAGLH